MQHFVTKWIKKCLLTEKILFCRKHSMTETCSLCNQCIENLTHILQCNHQLVSNTWIDSTTTLSNWLRRQDTDPTIQEIIINSITARDFNSTLILTPIPQSRDHVIALSTQTLIGWENFLLGYLSTHLVFIQHSYYQLIGSRGTGAQWGTSLIK